MLFRRFVPIALFTAASMGSAQPYAIGEPLHDPQGHPVGTIDRAYPPQLSGSVVDTTGAVIAGATVQVQSANSVVQRTAQSGTNGSFLISGLAAGSYRLVVSNPGFETKEILVAIGTNGTTALVRIALVVGAVSTTIITRAKLCNWIISSVSMPRSMIGNSRKIDELPLADSSIAPPISMR